jgi:hypothetical protein
VSSARTQAILPNFNFKTMQHHEKIRWRGGSFTTRFVVFTT